MSGMERFFSYSLRVKLVRNVGRIRYASSLRDLSGDVDAASSRRRIVFLGTPEMAAETLATLHENSLNSSIFQISYVVTQPPAHVGRQKKLTKNPVHVLAETLQLPVLTPETAKDNEFLETLEKDSIDLCITAAYGNYLPKRFLSLPKFGVINIHPSLLPLYRGAAPVQRCLENGDQVTGVTLLYSVAKMDAGPVIKQLQRPLKGDEKSSILTRQLFQEGTKELISLLPKIFDGSISMQQAVTIQDDNQATAAPKIASSEGLIAFDQQSATQIYNKFRAFEEWPGIYSYFEVKDLHSDQFHLIRMKLIEIVPLTRQEYPNHLSVNERYLQVEKLESNPKESILILTCADGSRIGILALQPENKKIMTARAYLNGFKGKPLVMRWLSSLELSTVVSSSSKS